MIADNVAGQGWFPSDGRLAMNATAKSWKRGRLRRLRAWKTSANLLLWRMTINHASQSALAEFGRKYLWWEPVGGQPHSEGRIIAQTMNLGTYDDTLLLERTIGKSRLVEIMLRAEPGWISDRSWEFWCGRLSFARRSFRAANT
jgi:hypothetical protein